MTPRERVLTSLNHEEPDRVPLFIGTSGATTVLGPGYERLKKHLGIRGGPERWLSGAMQYTWMDEEVFVRLGCDGRPVVPEPAEGTLSKKISNDYMIDDWGIAWRRAPGVCYFEATDPPLCKATIDDLDRYPWPNLASPSRFVGMAQQAKAVQDAGYASVVMCGVNLFEQAYLMRGLDTILMDIAADREFFTALIEKLKGVVLPCLDEMLREVGPYTDVLTGGTMMSPQSYRHLLKPHHADYFGTIKKHLAGKIFFHSCGNVYTLLGDLADVGVDLLNPVQVSAGEMGDTARLKREFGNRLSFCGAIDTRWTLPLGTTDDVRAEVRRRIHDLAPGGGYIVASVHCIQPDVPPENIVAMCDEVMKSGRYPLQV
jgi:uroporphyrinogen decarboxylase